MDQATHPQQAASPHPTAPSHRAEASSASVTSHPAAAPPTSHNHTLGAQGEGLASDYLEQQGYRVLARNWRDGRRGELDLVVRARDTIVAVEVKTRSGLGYGHPLEAVTARKSARLRRLLMSWVRENQPGQVRLRVDAIGITLRPGEHPRIDHLEGIA